MDARKLGLVLAALLSVSFLGPAVAQDGAKTRRVGVLFSGSLSDPVIKRCWQALADGLSARGWEEGRNLALEGRFSGPDPTRHQEQAEELVALKVYVMVAGTTQAIDAARRVTATIPIVMVNPQDPVKSGFVASLARPAGNITGLANQLDTVVAKHFELLKALRPEIGRVGIMYNPDNAGSVASLKYQQDVVAPRLALVVVPIPVSKPVDFDAAFAAIAGEAMDALHIHPAPPMFNHRRIIGAFAIKQGLPAVSAISPMAHAGLLMSYGPDVVASCRRSAAYVDLILEGANPAELPVELADRFELVVNLKTARELGLAIPPAILLRADEVIE
jgi:putative ABC transport system substrate-binding protein